jgi:FHS family L-fucose permease-like MFS transporter
LLLSLYGLCCSFFALGISQGKGVSGIVCLYFLFFFESICYPVCTCVQALSHTVSWLTWLVHSVVHLYFGYEESGRAHQERLWLDCHGEQPYIYISAIFYALLTWGTVCACQGVGGGAWFPSAQGAIANHSTRRSYLVPMSGYLAMTLYAVSVMFTPLALCRL